MGILIMGINWDKDQHFCGYQMIDLQKAYQHVVNQSLPIRIYAVLFGCCHPVVYGHQPRQYVLEWT
jgi:hypothetical protein